MVSSINELVQWLISDHINLTILLFVGDASLQQLLLHEYTSKHTLRERMHIQLAIEDGPRDEDV